jgi:hypothetical protein
MARDFVSCEKTSRPGPARLPRSCAVTERHRSAEPSASRTSRSVPSNAPARPSEQSRRASRACVLVREGISRGRTRPALADRFGKRASRLRHNARCSDSSRPGTSGETRALPGETRTVVPKRDSAGLLSEHEGAVTTGVMPGFWIRSRATVGFASRLTSAQVFNNNTTIGAATGATPFRSEHPARRARHVLTRAAGAGSGYAARGAVRWLPCGRLDGAGEPEG